MSLSFEESSGLNFADTEETDYLEPKKTLIQELSGGEVRHTQKVLDNFICFTGASGGTGTSTLVANLAYMAASKGLSVLVIDLNIAYPIQHSFFRIKQDKSKKDLVSVLLGKNELGESLESYGSISILAANNKSVTDVITCDTQECSQNFSDAVEAVRPLFDLILVDSSMNLSHDVINTAFYKAESIYTVWDENIGCVSNIERFRTNLNIFGIESTSKLRAIMNKRTSIHYPRYPFEKLGIKLLSTFPFELSIVEAGLRQEIFCESGASMSRNASYFVNEMQKLMYEILSIGGYNK